MSEFNNNPDLTPIEPEGSPSAQPIPPQQVMGQPVAPPPPPPPPPPYMEQMPHPQSTMAPYQQPPQNQPYQPYQPYQPPTADSKKPMAITSLILGIVSVIFCCFMYLSIPCGIIAIILGAIGLKSMSRGMAVAGIVLGIIGIALPLILILLAVIGILGESFGEFSNYY